MEVGVTPGPSIGQEHARYVGSRSHLYGMSALIRFHGNGIVGAQFDDWDTGLSHGWHPFRLSEFQPTEPRRRFLLEDVVMGPVETYTVPLQQFYDYCWNDVRGAK